MADESLIDEYKSTIEIMSQQLMILKEKISEGTISKRIREKINTKTVEIEGLSQECVELKKSLWLHIANKKWLVSENKRINNEALLSETILQGLKSKYEICKGTQIDKILLKVIKSYERYHSLMNSLRQLTHEKDDLLQNYKKITLELNQENNIRMKIKSLKDYSKEKERTTNELQNKLKGLRKEIEDTKISSDKCDVKALLDTRDNIGMEISACDQDKNVISIELAKMGQAIVLERNSNTISPEIGNKALKSKIFDVENQIAEIMKVIKGKEKEKEKLRLAAGKNGKKSFSSFEVSYRLSRTLSSSATPKNKPEISKSIASSPSMKMNNRDQIIKLLGNGINHQNSKKVLKAFTSFGNDRQSIASKIVQLNRGVFT